MNMQTGLKEIVGKLKEKILEYIKKNGGQGRPNMQKDIETSWRRIT